MWTRSVYSANWMRDTMGRCWATQTMWTHRPRIGSVRAGSSGLGSGVKRGLCHQGCTGYESAWEILGWRWREERSDGRKDNAEGQEPLWCRGPGIPSGAGTKLGLNAVGEGGALSDVWGCWRNNACSRWICQWSPSAAWRLLLRGLAKSKLLGPTLWIWKPGVEPESLHFLTGFQWL